MTFMPLLGYYVLRGQKGFESGAGGKGIGAKLARAYRSFAQWSLNQKAISLGVAVLLLIGGIFSLRSVGSAFFPKDLHSVFTVNLYLAEGTPIRHTKEEALRVIEEIERLAGDKIRSYTTFVGQGGPRFWLSIVPEQRSDNYAQILVHTVDGRVTEGLVNRLKVKLPSRLASARINIEQLETGPPIGITVQVRLFGDCIASLRRIAEDVKNQLREIPGTNNVHDDWESEVLQVGVTINPDRANVTGITHQDVALLLQTGLSGTAPTYLREEDRQVPIMFRLRADEARGSTTLRTSMP